MPIKCRENGAGFVRNVVCSFSDHLNPFDNRKTYQFFIPFKIVTRLAAHKGLNLPRCVKYVPKQDQITVVHR